MARTMKAMVVQEPYKMEYLDVPVPEINDDEVLIKVKVCGICGSDKSIYQGKYAKDKLPFIPGHEFWGVIEEVGKNVTKVKANGNAEVFYENLDELANWYCAEEGETKNSGNLKFSFTVYRNRAVKPF